MRIVFWLSLAGIVYTYLGYPAIMWFLSRVRPTPWKPAPFTPTVSEPPGYPVVLAILDFVAIHLSIGQLLTVRICQFAMVAATACLVYAIGRELDDEFTARVAALLTASYLPLLDLAGYRTGGASLH